MKFQKKFESGEYTIIPFTTVIFEYQFYLVFKDRTYYFSLTGHDLLEIDDHERQNAMYELLRNTYTGKSIAHALLLQIEYYFENRDKLIYISTNSFDCMKAKSYMGKWILEQIEKLHGYGMTEDYHKMVVKLIDSKTPA